jgi:gliding motility-associated-like protein
MAPNGCFAMDSTDVTVYKIPSADAGKDQILESEFETAMSGVLPSYAEGEWSVVSGWGNFVDKKSPVTVVNRLLQGENIFRWEVWNIREAACRASSEVMVTVKDLFIPGVITPNGDGVNDFFRINTMEEGIRLSIFNKWGVRVYESSSYKNDWDGTSANGQQLPEDTYFYILDFNGLRRKGAILIIR